jgi:hypothetical protein
MGAATAGFCGHGVLVLVGTFVSFIGNSFYDLSNDLPDYSVWDGVFILQAKYNI